MPSFFDTATSSGSWNGFGNSCFFGVITTGGASLDVFDDAHIPPKKLPVMSASMIIVINTFFMCKYYHTRDIFVSKIDEILDMNSKGLTVIELIHDKLARPKNLPWIFTK